MKKSIIALIVVLILTVALLVGCTANPAALEGYQRGSGYGANEQDIEAGTGAGYGADEQDVETGTGYGYGASGEDVGTGVGYGNGNGNGRRAAGDGTYCYPDTDEPSSSDVPAVADTELVADTEGYGSAGALADNDLTLADMLTYAIQDEYLARAEYASIIDTYGNIAPFRNIIRAEDEHASQLLVLFAEYGIAAPADTGSDYVAAVPSLTAAYQAGVDAEINNIAMYDKFLAQDLPADVRVVFESLRAASENHLAAFRVHL